MSLPLASILITYALALAKQDAAELPWNQNIDSCFFTFGNAIGHVEKGRVGQGQIPLQVFMFATALLAAFFGSITVALNWFD